MTTEDSVSYSLLAGPVASIHFEAMAELYRVVYAEPPYEEGAEEVDGFADGLPVEAVRPGFTVVAATAGQRLVGVAYGWTMPAGTWWSRCDGPAPEHIHTADKLAVMEWMVHPDRRGGGSARS